SRQPSQADKEVPRAVFSPKQVCDPPHCEDQDEKCNGRNRQHKALVRAVSKKLCVQQRESNGGSTEPISYSMHGFDCFVACGIGLLLNAIAAASFTGPQIARVVAHTFSPTVAGCGG